MSTIKSSDDHLTLNADGSGNDIKFQSNAVEKASIDSSGNLTVSGNLTSVGIDDNANATAITIDANESIMVNKTSENAAIAGAQFRGDAVGLLQVCRDGGDSLQLNRLSSDGNLVRFYKDTSNIGSIGSEGGDSLYIQGGTTSGSGLHFHPSSAAIAPARNGARIDNTLDFGTATNRFKNLYLSGGLLVGGTDAAHTLDDYEEGTWTPTVKGSSSDGSYTYDESRRWGKYSKVGNIVFVSFCFRINGGGAGSGSTQIWGLPYTPNVTVQDAYPRSPGICLAQSATAFTGTIICTIEGTSAYLGLQEQNTTTNVDIPVTDADLTNSIYSGSMVYWVS